MWMFGRRALQAALVTGLLAACGPEQAPLLEDPLGAQSQEVTRAQLKGLSLPDKTLALTFDDGPAGRTQELADYLQAQGISAAFFINGVNVPGREALLARLTSQGHLLANHTQTHRNLTTLTAAEVFQEVAQTDALLQPHVPEATFLLRAPYGAWNDAVADGLNATSMARYVGGIFWDAGGALSDTYAADWACWGNGLSIPDCANRYLAEIEARRRGIVLMHDVHGQTVDMVKLLVPALKARGYSFARVDAVPDIATAIGNSGAPVSADARVFDPAFYLAAYTDVRAWFGATNAAAAEHHWVAWGRDQGRLGSSAVQSRYYLARYGDLSAAFGATGYVAALRHWQQNGIREGREASSTFNAAYYLAQNPDVAAAFGAQNYAAALNHWQVNGIREGRVGSDLFSPSYYLATQPDVAAFYGAKNYAGALFHWLIAGLSEGRRGSPSFYADYYLSRYPDLAAAYGRHNYEAALMHWRKYGKAEGRRGAP